MAASKYPLPLTVTSHECYGFSNEQQLDCYNSLIKLTTKKTSHLYITGPLRRESISDWWITLTKGQPAMQIAFPSHDVIMPCQIRALGAWWTDSVCGPSIMIALICREFSPPGCLLSCNGNSPCGVCHPVLATDYWTAKPTGAYGTIMTSSNGNIFHITGPSCREFTGHQWIPRTKAIDTELDVFFDLSLNKQLSKQSWGWWFETPSCSLWCHCNEIHWKPRVVTMPIFSPLAASEVIITTTYYAANDGKVSIMTTLSF